MSFLLCLFKVRTFKISDKTDRLLLNYSDLFGANFYRDTVYIII